MNEVEWVEGSAKIQAEAQTQNKVSPFDVLILMGKRLSYRVGSDNWKYTIFKKVLVLRRRFIMATSKGMEWNRGAVLFFPTEPTHVNQMEPVAMSLSSQGVPYQFITPKLRIFRLLRSRQIKVILVPNMKSIKRNDVLMSLEQTKKAMLKVGCSEGIHIVEHYYEDIKNLSESLSELMRKLAPKYAFIGNDLTWECRLLARVSQLWGIRTGMIQHGLLGHEIYNRMHVVNDIYVYGSAFRRILKTDGLKGTNVIVTGAPYLDSKSPVVITSEPNTLLKSRFKISGSYVLIAFSGAGDRTTQRNYEIMLSWVKRLMDDHKELDIAIKLHRKERLSAYAAFSELQRSRIVDRDGGRGLPSDIFEWFKGCSCLITGTSTMAYEAMLYNIPIISVDPLNEYRGVNFVDERMVDVVYTYHELEEALIRVNGKKVDYRPFINHIFGALDGKAANRVVAGIANYAMR